MIDAVMMGPFAIIKEVFGLGVRAPFHLCPCISLAFAPDASVCCSNRLAFAQLGKKLLCLACCLVCVAIFVLMIPQVIGDLVTDFLLGGQGGDE
jgi:hypothetical protein